MSYLAESVATSATPYIGVGVGGIALLGGIYKGMAASFTRTPANSAGVWIHHGRPYSRGGNVLRRMGVQVGKIPGELYDDVEPGSHLHLPKSRGISWVGTHWRTTPLEPGDIDNTNTDRQHYLDATILWRVAPKRDDTGKIIKYIRNDEPTPYKQLVYDAIYKVGDAAVGGVQQDVEGALVTTVRSICKSGLREVMTEHVSSHEMTDHEATKLLKEARETTLFEFGVQLGGVMLQDTHLTDRMPHAIKQLGISPTAAAAFDEFAKRGMHAIPNPTTSA